MDSYDFEISPSEIPSYSFLVEEPIPYQINLKEQKFCRCPICKKIVLIFIYDEEIYLKCVYCDDVYTKRNIHIFIKNDLITFENTFLYKNIKKSYIKNSQIIQNTSFDGIHLPILCIDDFCETHFKSFYSFCKKCKINLCQDCIIIHNNEHKKDIMTFNEYKKEYKINNEIENIQKIIDESKEYINSDDVVNIIDKVLGNLREEINEFIQENYNNLNLNKETIEDLITKVPNNIEDIVNFPINLIDYINEITKKKKRKFFCYK